MTEEKGLVHCYNRGCGQKFDPQNNNDDNCVHHPGAPIFHDAYKSWSCCKKKCIDFTEFLNIKGCTKSNHSNIKPPEPEKPASDKSEVVEVYTPPINSTPAMARPPFETPQVALTPVVSPNLLEQIKGLKAVAKNADDPTSVVIGQSCKNKACKSTYKGPETNEEICKHHPGFPIFHEGLKYWSCCQKKTTDFSVFLEQPGCSEGNHVWFDKKTSSKNVQCRMDWHQTGGFVVISVYAKKYDPNESTIKLNPIRLTVNLYFSEENSRYNLDVELRGIASVEDSSVNMLPTKVEIKLKKAEPGSWSALYNRELKMVEEPAEEQTEEESIQTRVDAVDLSDL